jgi:hypothetical protein
MGPPSTWQGWVVLAGYVGLLVALSVLVPADRHPYWFWAGLMALLAGLIAICWWKGETPKWRWNKFGQASATRLQKSRPSRNPKC